MLRLLEFHSHTTTRSITLIMSLWIPWLAVISLHSLVFGFIHASLLSLRRRTMVNHPPPLSSTSLLNTILCIQILLFSIVVVYLNTVLNPRWAAFIAENISVILYVGSDKGFTVRNLVSCVLDLVDEFSYPSLWLLAQRSPIGVRKRRWSCVLIYISRRKVYRSESGTLYQPGNGEAFQTYGNSFRS